MSAPIAHRTLARLMLRHQLAVAHELLPLELLRAMEREIARLLHEIGLVLEYPVRRCGLATAIGSTHIERDGFDQDLVAAQILLIEFGKTDPLSRMFRQDDYEVLVTRMRFEEVFGPSSKQGLFREAMLNFLPPLTVDRYEELQARPGADAGAIAKFLMVALEHESHFEPIGPQFEWLDMSEILATV